MAVCLSGVDAVSMAVLGVAALEWEGTDKAERADNAVIIIQLTVLVGGTLFMCFEFRMVLSRSANTFILTLAGLAVHVERRDLKRKQIVRAPHRRLWLSRKFAPWKRAMVHA